jgi:hypothetical protein
MRTVTGAIVFILSLGIAPIVGAQSSEFDKKFKEADAAYARGEFTTVVNIYRSLSVQGDADAQVNLGAMYHAGKGVPKDNVRAYMWFEVAAIELALFGNEDPVERCRILAEEMTTAEVEQAKKMAEQCFDSVYKQCD